MASDDMQGNERDADLLALAEDLRRAVGGFVRKVRAAADTPAVAGTDTLGELDRAGPMSVAMLARQRGVRHQSMRVIVAQLEADRLVRRVPDPADGRGQIVCITEAGQVALARSRAARTNWITASLRRDASMRERKALRIAISVLQRLAAVPE